MTVIGRIRSVMPSASSIITKGLGIVALGIVAKDSNHLGKVQADLYASKKDADAAAHYLNNSLYLSDMRKSNEAIKDTAYRFELDQTYKRFFNEGIGYIKGFTSMLINNVIPLGLGIGATFGGKHTAKISTIGLVAYGVYRIIRNAFGIGVPNGIKSPD